MFLPGTSGSIKSEEQFLHANIPEEQAHGMLVGQDGALRSPGTFLVWMPSKNADQFALSVVSEDSK